VNDAGHAAGMITPHDLMRIERQRWPDVTVGDVMRPLEMLNTVAPATPAADALKSMMRTGLTQLPVVADGHVEGIVSRNNILQLLQSRTELSKAS
jgi:CBS domain-containing protein